jgi:catechol 2,3-dioxygenase-like lactoylglutathione lyase family enzyme
MARIVGINHVALEVGDIDEALDWYGRLFDIELRGRPANRMAFVHRHGRPVHRARAVLRAMRLDRLGKTDAARAAAAYAAFADPAVRVVERAGVAASVW